MPSDNDANRQAAELAAAMIRLSLLEQRLESIEKATERRFAVAEKTSEKGIAELQSNQRWVVLVVIGAVIKIIIDALPGGAP